MTQRDEVLDYLERYASITQGEALQELGIARLAARIHELRQMGVPILTKLVDVPTRNGRKAKVAVYYLLKQEAVA